MTPPADKKLWRETPLLESLPLSNATGCRVFLKLEQLQPSGSFKSRGIGQLVLNEVARRNSSSPAHLYISSSGNAGLACVNAGASLDLPVTVVVPLSTKPHMIAKLKAFGARDVIQQGAAWPDADKYLRDELLAKDPNGVYVPPFDHPDIFEGNSTVVKEIQQQLRSGEGSLPAFRDAERGGVGLEDGHAERPPAAILCAVGGGGLFSGVMRGLEQAGWSDVSVLALETLGADSLNSALRAGELVTLPAITSQATGLGATRVARQAFEVAQRPNVRSVVLSDAEAAMGCWRLAEDERILVELSSGVTVGLCYSGKLEQMLGRKLRREDKIVVILCGGSMINLDMLHQWKKEFTNVIAVTG